MSDNQPKNNEPKTFEQAREQSAEYIGFLASQFIKTERGDVFEIPSINLLDDDQQSRYDKLQLEIESWDRGEPVLNEDGSERTKGELLEPNRKNGELVENYNIQLAKAIFGDRYETFKAAGGRASDVRVTWWKMNKILVDRQKKDPKSDDSPADLDTVPDSD
jgi:hypothetical protein